MSLRPGELINVVNTATGSSSTKLKRFSGPWLIGEITHIITNESNHRMRVLLHRDSNTLDPNTSEEPGFFEMLGGWFS